MNILIVGNDPKEIGGVANYTRPLAAQFVAMGHHVNYLFSGAYASRYDLLLRPYIKCDQTGFPFEGAEVINSACLPFNYGDPSRDISQHEMERTIASYLDRINPDVMHVHSRLGLPFSINRLAYERGIKVFNTIHVYGYICQKRVMVDHMGEPCNGPNDLQKCARCTDSLDIGAEFRRARIRSLKEYVKLKSKGLYHLLQRSKRSAGIAWSPGVTPVNKSAPIDNPALVEKLGYRLRMGIDVLNRYSDLVICVSNDVRTTLMQFGADDNKLLVQHIGSMIAEGQVMPEHILQEPIMIGNIGGVNYYKGTHVLLDAVSKLNRKDFKVKIFGKYNEQYVSGLTGGKEELPVEFTGRYMPRDLPEILQQIDIMVLPSICNDTAPQTIFESFSGGVPIIASDIGGFPDFVRHGENGRLFRPGDSDDLARQLARVLDDRSLILKYRVNIPRLKTISENAAELLTLYREYNREAAGSTGRDQG